MTIRDQWWQILSRASGDERLMWGVTIAMENASATVADEGLTSQDDLWFETAIWTWREWEDAPWGLEGTRWDNEEITA